MAKKPARKESKGRSQAKKSTQRTTPARAARKDSKARPASQPAAAKKSGSQAPKPPAAGQAARPQAKRKAKVSFNLKKTVIEVVTEHAGQNLSPVQMRVLVMRKWISLAEVASVMKLLPVPPAPAAPAPASAPGAPATLAPKVGHVVAASRSVTETAVCADDQTIDQLTVTHTRSTMVPHAAAYSSSVDLEDTVLAVLCEPPRADDGRGGSGRRGALPRLHSGQRQRVHGTTRQFPGDPAARRTVCGILLLNGAGSPSAGLPGNLSFPRGIPATRSRWSRFSRFW